MLHKHDQIVVQSLAIMGILVRHEELSRDQRQIEREREREGERDRERGGAKGEKRGRKGEGERGNIAIYADKMRYRVRGYKWSTERADIVIVTEMVLIRPRGTLF